MARKPENEIQTSREDRLKQALKANMAKRKAQAAKRKQMAKPVRNEE